MLRRYFLCLLCWMLLGCGVKKSPLLQAVPAAKETSSSSPAVVFLPEEGRQHAVEVVVEVPRTRAEQAQGLMFRSFLGEGTGMLFVFPETGRHPFWMRNTYIPLDLIFLDEAGTVVAVIERARPLDETTLEPGVASRYVLEVPAGYAARQHIRPGIRGQFRGVQD